MPWNCPQCESENTQKLSLAVESGTHKTSSGGVGLGLTGAGLGVIGGKTRGRSVSKTAQKYAEPEKAPIIGGFFAALFFAGIAAAFFGWQAFQIGFWIAVILTAFAIFYNLKVYPTEKAEWDSKFICLRCSAIFEVNGREIGIEP